MIDAFKLQSDILKLIKKDELTKLRYQQTEDNTYITVNGYNILIVPTYQMYIDFDRLKDRMIDFTVYFKKMGDYTAKPTGVQRVMETTKNHIGVVSEIKSDGGQVSVWVQEKLLKEYGKDVYFQITSSTAPVYVFDRYTESCIGMICAVNTGEYK